MTIILRFTGQIRPLVIHNVQAYRIENSLLYVYVENSEYIYPMPISILGNR